MNLLLSGTCNYRNFAWGKQVINPWLGKETVKCHFNFVQRQIFKILFRQSHPRIYKPTNLLIFRKPRKLNPTKVKYFTVNHSLIITLATASHSLHLPTTLDYQLSFHIVTTHWKSNYASTTHHYPLLHSLLKDIYASTTWLSTSLLYSDSLLKDIYASTTWLTTSLLHRDTSTRLLYDYHFTTISLLYSDSLLKDIYASTTWLTTSLLHRDTSTRLLYDYHFTTIKLRIY